LKRVYTPIVNCLLEENYMTTTVTVKVGDISSQPVKLISGDDEVFVGASETKSVEIREGEELRVVPTEAPEPPQASTDAFDPTNRPNGIQQAVIAPKLPKASGELKDVEEEGKLVQRAVTPDDAVATQGGGPEAEVVGETPGPDPTEPSGEQPPSPLDPPPQPQDPIEGLVQR
jgi:hypothetical protein